MHRPGREATRGCALRVPARYDEACKFRAVGCRIANCTHMARLLVADATRPPCRDGRATPSLASATRHERQNLLGGGAGGLFPAELAVNLDRDIPVVTAGPQCR